MSSKAMKLKKLLFHLSDTHFWPIFSTENHKNWIFSKGHNGNICLRPDFNEENMK